MRSRDSTPGSYGHDSLFPYDGSSQSFDAWRRDHTLQSAMRFSVVWWFQRVAEKLGATREREYLRRLGYGNADPSSGLTTFWLGGSLVISPEEQKQFLLRLFANDLAGQAERDAHVREILVQPDGMVVNASGEHPFGGPGLPAPPSGPRPAAAATRAASRSGGLSATSPGHAAPGYSSVASSGATTHRRSRPSIWQLRPYSARA